MEYRTLGRTGLQVSVVGVGTAQYRMIPEEQALATLRTAFSLGVNIVHAAPDYEGSLDLVARAVRDAQQEILVLSQGYGDSSHMEYLFQETCRKLGKDSLTMFGLACIDDRELLGENVWGAGGQIEFLQEKKRAGKIRHLFCTTHGSAEYLKKLIAADVFDALFFAFNPLGSHLLSYNQKDRAIRERLADNAEIIQLASAANLGVMIMKPLAGGLLCRGKAFPERSAVVPAQELNAAEILRYLLVKYPQISCVMPGTASPEEARENAQAAMDLREPQDRLGTAVEKAVSALQSRLCTRCGECEKTCSRQLPVSWLFRAAYVHNSGAMVFETLDPLQYRVLHPWEIAACATCDDKTCRCPIGLDIPQQLCEIHDVMQRWEKESWLPASDVPAPGARRAEFSARLFSHNLLQRTSSTSCIVILKNTGAVSWRPAKEPYSLAVCFGKKQLVRVGLRGEIPPGENAHFSFWLKELPPEAKELTLTLEREQPVLADESWTGRLWRLIAGKKPVDPFFAVSVKLC